MLIDSFGRVIRYLRVSVTDRCNLFCSYCRLPTDRMLPNNHELLSFEELVRLLRLFLDLGVEQIRLTGGEPLLRRNIVNLVRSVAMLPGLRELTLSTNALLLEHYAVPLRVAGLQRVNISLDSLDPTTFATLTQRPKTESLLVGDTVVAQPTNHLAAVLAGIKAAMAAGLRPVKVNMVVMRGVNVHEIPDMVRFAKEQGVVLRFIETMPVGEAGMGVSNQFVPAAEILEIIRDHFSSQLLPVPSSSATGTQGSGPARYFVLSGTNTEVGVISAQSRHFCDTCNRMRLTSKGNLVYCLGRQDRMDLKTAMRNGASDTELQTLIRQAVSLKPERHEFERLDTQSRQTQMAALGG